MTTARQRLVIALVMVFIVAVIVAAVLQLRGHRLKVERHGSQDRSQQISADDAMQAAVQYLLQNPTSHCGLPGSTAGLLLSFPPRAGRPSPLRT